MTWNIASAKQQFSEVVRLTAEEPQAIYNRDKPVAVLISMQDYEDFQRWRAERDRPTLSELFDEIRAKALCCSIAEARLWASCSTKSARFWQPMVTMVLRSRPVPPVTTPWSMTHIIGTSLRAPR